jgi:ParE toxin of type II toxin-antitoxin system, parDE
MSHPVVLSADAITDIDQTFEYYNSRSYGLGFEFTDTLDAYFKKISRLPTASAIRYDNVRVKPIDTFPYTIHFTIEEDGSVIILRVFNTYQEPLH